jgi:HD-GYP domain-containing protein (c-di-GMP phosphodiesterase class II)
LPITTGNRPWVGHFGMEASSLTLHEDPELLVAEARERSGDRVRYRELAVELAVGAAFAVAATAVALLAPWDRAFSGGAFAICIAALLIASRVSFEIGDGYAVPTQIVFVAELFVLPKPIVPAAVAAGLLLARVLDAAGSRMHPSRVVQGLGDSWYAIGPALVLSLAAPGGVSWSHWPIYLAALGAQFAVDFVWSTVRGHLASGVPLRTMVRVLAWVYAVDATLAPMGLLLGFAAADRPYLILLGLPVVGLLAYFAKERRARLDQAFELSGAYRGTAMLLGQVVESDDAYTGEHSRGVVELAMAVANRLSLDARARLRVEFGALLHDIGKISVPKEILNKPGPLDPDEWDVMHRHTLEGERMLQPIGGLLAEVGRIVRSSHEHFDGSGYPDRLAGVEIPIEARIVSCCDAFSAMTTDRPYRAAMPFEEALLELQACAGTQFDPAVAEALAAVVTS